MAETILLTGATGVLGSAIALELARQLSVKKHKVIAIIRAKDDTDLATRRDEVFKFIQSIDPSMNDAHLVGLFEFWRGDLAKADLGLAPEKLARLETVMNYAIHSAAKVKMNMSQDEALASCFTPLVHVTQVCEKALKRGVFSKLDFVGTVGVIGKMQGVLSEDFVVKKPEYHNTYESTKAHAEEWLREKMQAGFPATIHRPSMIVGDSSNGNIMQYQGFYHICDFLSGQRTRGWLPYLPHFQLDTVPSDYVARAIVSCVFAPTALGKIIHLCSGPQNSWQLTRLQQLIWQVAKERGPIFHQPKQISWDLFRALVRAMRILIPGRAGKRIGAIEYFFEYLMDRQAFATEKSDKILAGLGVFRPPPEKYLKVVLENYWRNRK